MATNNDFNTLIGRIDKATTTLENNVSVLVQSSTDVTASVTEAKGYASDAKASVAQATQKATIATEQATNATEQANKATTEATKAVNAVEQAKALAPFQEAPKDGGLYGRKNGVWTLVENTGGSTNAVKTVNNTAPDVNGNVTINIPTPTEQVNADWNATTGKAQILNKPTLFNGDYNNLTNKPVLFSGNYNDLTNKPTIPTVPTKVSAFTNDSGFITEAPNDGKQYARKSNAWAEVQAGGGYDVINSYPTALYTYADTTTTAETNIVWNKLSEVATRAGITRSLTPSTPIPLNMFYKMELSPRFGRNQSTKYNNLFASGTKIALTTLPSGLYSVSTTDFVSPVPFAGKEGLLRIEFDPINPARSQVTFYEYVASTGTTPSPTTNKIYVWQPNSTSSGNEKMWSTITGVAVP